MDGAFYDKLLAEVDLAAAPPGLIEEARECAAKGVRQLQPRLLILNMSAAMISIARHSGARRGWRSIAGYGRMGRRSIDELDEFGLTWLEHCAYVHRILEDDPVLTAARARLHRAGAETRWIAEEEVALRGYAINVRVDDESLAIVRTLAKQDAGITDPAASAEWDRRFDLYVNQHYAEDWEDWRRREPLAELP